MARVGRARLLSLVTLLAIVAANSATTETYQFPPEWEPHEAVWLGWPPFVYLEKYNRTNRDVSVDIMCTLANFSVPVRLAVSDAQQFSDASSMLALRCPQHSVGKSGQHQGIPAPSISVFDDMPHSDAWWRDMGAQFLVGQNQEEHVAAPLQVLDVNFNYWGWALDQEGWWHDSSIDENVDRLTAMQLGLQTATHTDWFHEGGNVDVFRPARDGPFTHMFRMMTVRAVEVHRNPHLTLRQIEKRMLASYGYSAMLPEIQSQTEAPAVLWLDEGMVDDALSWTGPFDFGLGQPVYTFGTGGHVDEVARWTPDGSVLLTMPSEEDAAQGPAQNESRKRMLRNAELLRRADIMVIELPAVPTLTISLEPNTGADPLSMYAGLREERYRCDSDTPYAMCQAFPDGKPVRVAVAASYANYLVTNGVVLMQRYCVPGLCESRPELAAADARAEAVLRQVYGRDREVVGIDAFATNVGGGGVHCYTQQQPSAVGRSLRREPSLRTQAAQG